MKAAATPSAKHYHAFWARHGKVANVDRGERLDLPVFETRLGAPAMAVAELLKREADRLSVQRRRVQAHARHLWAHARHRRESYTTHEVMVVRGSRSPWTQREEACFPLESLPHDLIWSSSHLEPRGIF